MAGQKTFRVKLNGVERICSVGQSHYCIITCAGGYREALQCFRGRKRRKRMISGRSERRRKAGEQSLLVVMNFARLPMHGDFGRHSFAAERLVDALHAQTDPENRNPEKKMPDYLNRYPGIPGIAGTRAYQNAVRFHLLRFAKRYGIVSMCCNCEIMTHKKLYQVVSERIVVIYYKESFQTSAP